MSPPARTRDLPERPARLKDGRILHVRHGRPGDEAGIARLVTAAFPVYERAASGDRSRAARSFARELRPQEFVVASLADGGEPIGVSCVSGRAEAGHGSRTEAGHGSRAEAGLGGVARIRRKIESWGVAGLLCFALEKVRSRLFEARYRAGPGELYRYLDAVDVRYRSLGVARHIADFVDDYGRAAGYHSVSAKHHADNHPVLGLHRKRGCVLVALRPTLLARMFRRPHMVVSTRALCAPASQPVPLEATPASHPTSS